MACDQRFFRSELFVFIIGVIFFSYSIVELINHFFFCVHLNYVLVYSLVCLLFLVVFFLADKLNANTDNHCDKE